MFPKGTTIIYFPTVGKGKAVTYECYGTYHDGANDFSFSNKALQNATMQIVRLTERAKDSMYQIAHIIALVDGTECYKDDGFNNVHEWTGKILGYKKSMSYDLLKIGRDYTREILGASGKVKGYECNLLPEGCKDNFSTTQVIRMLPAGREIVCELVEDSVIVPSMTGKEITKVIKERLGTDSEPETENESEEGGKRDNKSKTRKGVNLSEVSTKDLIYELSSRGFVILDDTGAKVEIKKEVDD